MAYGILIVTYPLEIIAPHDKGTPPTNLDINVVFSYMRLSGE